MSHVLATSASHVAPALSPLLLAALLLWISAAAVASKPPLDTLGIPPQDEVYYRGGVIKCKDRSSKFTRDQLNDVFYDYPDGFQCWLVLLNILLGFSIWFTVSFARVLSATGE